MMQPELLLVQQPCWPVYSFFGAPSVAPNMDSFIVSENQSFHSSMITSPDISSGVPSVSYLPMLSEESDEFPSLGFYEMQNPNDEQEVVAAIKDMAKWLCEDEEEESTDFLSRYESPMIQDEAMEIDSQVGIQHLLQAYAEAMEMGQRELAGVLVKRISEKANPLGQTLERVAFNLFHCTENQGEYLKQESRKNYKAAFKAFYDIFPYGRFAHFAANSAILEAIPHDAERVHIVDFDMGEGIQWPPIIEAIAQRRKALRITSIKTEGHDQFGFEQTRMQLCNHARSFGLNLKVEEKGIRELLTNPSEWLAFNCMVGLPHMGRTGRRDWITEFLRFAKEPLARNRGIIILGETEYGDRMKNDTGYSSFFDGCLAHYQALYESMEWGFPTYLREGRIAMESLFVAPYISSLAWFQKWEEGRECPCIQAGLRGRKLSSESEAEAKEMVKEGESPYKVKIGGQCGNEMVLEWRETPLVRVSAWM